MSLMNRLGNSQNPFQGPYKKVLAVCSAGLLRSPTTAFVLSQEPYNFNTRAVGLEAGFALIPIDEVLLSWADEIVCMTKEQRNRLLDMTTKQVICLDIPDNFSYRDAQLIELIRKNYDAAMLKLSDKSVEDPLKRFRKQSQATPTKDFVKKMDKLKVKRSKAKKV